jgi:hypothetical protein
MLVLIVSIISSILSCGLISISSATVVAKEDDDGERFEFITTLLRRMAARGAEFSTAAACDNSVVRAGAIPMADHEGLKQQACRWGNRLWLRTRHLSGAGHRSSLVIAGLYALTLLTDIMH